MPLFDFLFYLRIDALIKVLVDVVVIVVGNGIGKSSHCIINSSNSRSFNSFCDGDSNTVVVVVVVVAVVVVVIAVAIVVVVVVQVAVVV